MLSLGLLVTACIAPPGDVGELPGTGSGSEGSTGPSDTGLTEESSGEPPPACDPCLLDVDGDLVGTCDDNAPQVFNPDQSDLDEDGVADPIDLCPSVVSAGGDDDVDGLGGECDPCRRAAEHYEQVGVDVLGFMRVRNIPSVRDSDNDGIGDACDNCVVVPNCESYGPADPWRPGDPIADDDESLCQADANDDMVGDACEGLELFGSAGPVGMGPDDDFDQDGIINVLDACPRSPLFDAIACTSDDECPTGRKCELAAQLCDHLDTDADGVGDECDTCLATENPLQVADGAMQEVDDSDGDFIGDACESGPACASVANPARMAFYPVSVGGWCCTVQYPGDGQLFDPDGLPVAMGCSPAEEAANTCRRVPSTAIATPGVVHLPAGCEQALTDAGLWVGNHLPLTPDDVGGLDGLWEFSCRVPPLDSDFDGLGDACDLCPFGFDPNNEVYIDDEGQAWPDQGKYCNGEYAPATVCE